MKFKALVNTVAKAAQKHSPEILIGVGCVASVGAMALAIKATIDIKDDEELYYHVDQIQKCKEDHANGLYDEGQDFEEQSYAADLTKHYVGIGKEVAKHYAIPVALEVAALGTVFTSNKISRERNASLTAALTTVEAAYSRYRKNVVERFDEETDRELLYGYKKEKVTVEEEDPETGKKKKVKKEGEVGDPTKAAEQKFTFLFDEASALWTKSRGWNRDVVSTHMVYDQNVLDCKGWLTVLDVLDGLDLLGTVDWSRISEEELTDYGWIKGDRVDYGIFDWSDEAKVQFMKGDERSLYITLNPHYIRGKVFSNPRNKRAVVQGFPTGRKND